MVKFARAEGCPLLTEVFSSLDIKIMWRDFTKCLTFLFRSKILPVSQLWLKEVQSENFSHEFLLTEYILHGHTVCVAA